ncbi:hypothetical protein ACIRPX_04130 [Streptomyces sp. NPDC101225]|uniref:hypothetical protein n=1 Tax=Streptomyces sp. NPDC101225 TaxID=3366135 RepID=UPI0038147E57
MNAVSRAQLLWVPPEGTIWHVEAGTHFDAVRVGRIMAVAALALLEGKSGAVICDPWSRIHYFLAEPSSTSGWNVPGTTPCGLSTYVVVPPLNTPESALHWAVRPSQDRPFTPVYRLREALSAAVDAQHGNRAEDS